MEGKGKGEGKRERERKKNKRKKIRKMPTTVEKIVENSGSWNKDSFRKFAVFS